MYLNNMTSVIEQLHEALTKGEISTVALAERQLTAIRAGDADIHAFLTLTDAEALRAAEAVDAKLARGEEIGLLEGIPIALKDNILLAGEKATAGSKILEPYTAAYDATVVRKLKEAGAVIVGKTNLDEFAMGSSSENSAFGPTRNPRNLERVPGGSSAGSAAAVAAGFVPVALGSDTGGSIRQPASFCGVVGFKPTYGMVSRYGVVAMASSLDQIGPFGATVRDAEILFDAIGGTDEHDATTLTEVHDPHLERDHVRVGIPKEYFAEGLDAGVRASIENAINELRRSGAEIVDISLPSSAYALACYYVIMPAEVSANLARFDGVRYGLHESRNVLHEEYLASRTNGFGREVRRRIMLGTYVLSSGYYDAYYAQAQKVRALLRKEFDEAFKNVDVILTPTAPTVAFPFGEKAEDPLTMYLSDIYTVPVNLAGLPALSVPCGNVDGLPVGLQMIGRPFEDKFLLALGKKYEALRGPFPTC